LFDLLVALICGVRPFPAVESLADVLGEASHENEIKYPAAGAEASGHALGGVMIEVMFLHVPEVGIAKIVEVRGVMNPFFGDIGLEREGQDNRSSERWEQQNTQWHSDEEERQQIAHASAHVIAVKRFFVMPEM
jgi:hypothetical protein